MHSTPPRVVAGVAGVALALLLAGLASTVSSQTAPAVKPEQAIKYRQSVYKVILWNFGPMSAAVKGEVPYDAAAFARRAERVATMAPMLLEGYPPGSSAAADPSVHTRAKPEIWANMDEFRTLMQSMQDRAANLATVARAGDFEDSKAAFGELGKACGACHDKYRSD